MTDKFPNGVLKTSAQVDQAIDGKIPFTSLGEAAQNLLGRAIYDRAVAVLAGGTREERATRLALVPDAIRDRVEAEAKAIFERRKSSQ
jgi:hypothetical protein